MAKKVSQRPLGLVSYPKKPARDLWSRTSSKKSKLEALGAGLVPKKARQGPLEPVLYPKKPVRPLELVLYPKNPVRGLWSLSGTQISQPAAFFTNPVAGAIAKKFSQRHLSRSNSQKSQVEAFGAGLVPLKASQRSLELVWYSKKPARGL